MAPMSDNFYFDSDADLYDAQKDDELVGFGMRWEEYDRMIRDEEREEAWY